MSALRVLLGVLLAGMAFSSFASTYPNRDAVRAVATAGANYVYWPDAPGSAVRIGNATVAAGASNVPTIVRSNLPVPVPGGGTIYGDARVVGTARAIGRALYRASPYIVAAGLISDIAPFWTGVGYSVDSAGAVRGAPAPWKPQDGLSGLGGLPVCPGGAATINPTNLGLNVYCRTDAESNAAVWGVVDTDSRLAAASVCPQFQWISNQTWWHRIQCASAGGYNFAAATPAVGPLVTESELLDAIASRSTWPTSAALALQRSLVYPDIAETFDSDVAAQTPTIDLRDSSGSPVASGTPVPVGTPRVITRSFPNPVTGDPMTETKTETTTGTATGNQVTYNTSTVTTITNNTTNITETVETEEKPAEDIETCGLPGKPACVIDERNTGEIAEQARTRHSPQQDAADAYNPLKDFLENAESTLPQFPTINWAFTLPTGCAAIALPAFEPFLQQIDVCQFQPLFHDVMTVVWLLGGLFGAIGTFWRNTFATS